jgi:para-aminobenzoate synthetase / 4-amino-4-deoxychorismate lyase
VVRRPLDCEWSPTQVALALRDSPGLAVLAGRWMGGGAVIAVDPVWVATPDTGHDPFDLLDAVAARGVDLAARGDPHGGIGGGLIGYLGYQAGRLVERLPAPPTRPHPLPDWHLACYDHVLRLDPATGWWLEALAGEQPVDRVDDRATAIGERLRGRPPEPAPVEISTLRATPGGADHRKAVRRALDLIGSGDIYQANVCLRLDGELEQGAPLDLWTTAVDELSPDYAAFIDLGDGRAVSSLSPEQFLRRRGRQVTTSPIKGTRPRVGPDAERMRAQLAGSEKDRAENVMIVDLMRNDLGRVCEPGSVSVPRLFEVEAHPGVWHLVSQVQGRVRADVGDGALMKAAFPPGSVTGAPKVRAMEVIAEVEATAREVYTGSIGLVSPIAGAEWNVAIRTFEHAGSTVWLGVGGGIVAESDPDAELAECLTKARPLVAALGGSIAPID